jgi:hypothetical protein
LPAGYAPLNLLRVSCRKALRTSISGDGIMSSKLVAGGVLAVVGLIAIKIVTMLFALTIGFFALMFKLLPIVLIAWIVWRLVKYVGRPSTSEV